MQKNILLFLLITILFSGLYGCSCSQKPLTEPELPAGLYIKNAVITEENDGQTEGKVTILLQRNHSDAVSVKYQIFAKTDTSKPVAVIGGAVSDNNTDLLSIVDVLSFSEPQAVIFGATDTVLEIPFTIVNDTVYEEDEVFLVKLSDPVGAGIATDAGVAEVIIKNDDDEPVASFEIMDTAETASSLNEASPAKVSLKVSLNTVSAVAASLELRRSSETISNESKHGKLAAYRVDYMLYQGDTKMSADADIVIPAGELESFIDVIAIDDGVREQSETFDLTLSAKEHATTGTSVTTSFSITDNDTNPTVVLSKLNDTGIFKLPVAAIDTDAQGYVDMSVGRDSTVTAESKIGAGQAGFDFTKIEVDDDGDGVHDCVKDNVTGLIWEVKVKDNVSERGSGRQFSWYDPDYLTNGGDEGSEGPYDCISLLKDSDGNVLNLAPNCSTAYYVADMNETGLCGMSNWRLPTIEELRSIIDYGKGYGLSKSMRYDTEYFAGDTIGSNYIWSSTTSANDASKAWAIRFGSNFIEELRSKNSALINSVRLVNDSQIQ